MRKVIALVAVLCLLLSFGAALAEEPVAIRITPLDYQTGRAVSKTYVENELFRLRVDIDIPRFVDLSSMQLIIETDGVTVEKHDLVLMDGTYYITGVVTDQPAAIKVKAKDTRYDTAQTAEELYNAMQNDRTVQAAYCFYSTAASTNSGIFLPKTGSMSIIGPVVALLGLSAVALGGRKWR